jgi:hypothetical protein
VEQERELCCDELAVAATGERLVYVRTLAAVASAPLAPAALAVSITGERKMQLLNRVRHVLAMGAKPARAGWWPVGLLLVLLPVLMWFLVAGIPGGTRALADAPREGEARERGDRESPEAKAGRGRKDGERKADREKSDEQGGLEDFEPKNEREAQLLKKIRALESELKQLRSTDQGKVLLLSKDGTLVFDGGTLTISGITVDVTQGKPPAKDAPKKDGDVTISAGTLKLGAATVDTKVTVGATTQPAKRDRKDGGKPGPKDGDQPTKKGPRDGDRPRTGPRDGDQPKAGPRDGDRPKEGPRDG